MKMKKQKSIAFSSLGTNLLHDQIPRAHQMTRSTLHTNEHCLCANHQTCMSHAETLYKSFPHAALTCSNRLMAVIQRKLKMNLFLMTRKMFLTMSWTQRNILNQSPRQSNHSAPAGVLASLNAPKCNTSFPQ